MKTTILNTAGAISSLNQKYADLAKHRWDRLTKPRGSLGRLEDIVCQIAAIRENVSVNVAKKQVYIFAGDHGVAAEGVSAYPQEVTPQMVLNFLQGGAAINALSNQVGAEVKVIDVGVKHNFNGLAGLIHKKVRPGTRNFIAGSAMTEAEASAAIGVGLELAQYASAEGVDLIATGEMGVGNTTASSAIAAALMKCDVEAVTGLGAGLTDTAKKHKIDIIKQALAVNRERLTDPFNILAALGGLEIAGLCGLIIGGALHRIPMMIDGFIASAAALVAIKLNPAIQDFLIFAHQSKEPGHRLLLQHIGAKPILDLEMRLGEGSGAALAMSIVAAAVKLYSEMATFEEAQVSGKRDA